MMVIEADISRAYDLFESIWNSAEYKGWDSVRLRFVDLQRFVYYIVKGDQESLMLQNELVFLANIAAELEYMK